MSILTQLNEELKTVASQVDQIRNQWKGNESHMPPAVEEQFDKAIHDYDEITGKIERHKKAEAISNWASQDVSAHRIAPSDDKPRGLGSIEKEVHNAYLASLCKVESQESNQILRNASQSDLQALSHAYQADNMAGGGYFVTPMQMANDILTLMKDLVFIRGMATQYSLPQADTLGVPAIDTDPSDDDWTTELRTGNQETTAAAGRRELKTNPMAKLVLISKTLLRKAPNFEEVFLDRLAYKASITEEKAFLNGDGSQKPLGVFVASTKGISTNRDITAASTTAFTADELINTYMALKAQYRVKAKWIIHRDVLKAARKLKDNNNNYLWATGIGPGTGFQGAPPTLLGQEYCESEYAPNTFTTGQYMAIIGDFSKYWIADALDMQIQVLQELYAATNQQGYILRKETDGMPVLEEAFARLKLA